MEGGDEDCLNCKYLKEVLKSVVSTECFKDKLSLQTFAQPTAIENSIYCGNKPTSLKSQFLLRGELLFEENIEKIVKV